MMSSDRLTTKGCRLSKQKIMHRLLGAELLRVVDISRYGTFESMLSASVVIVWVLHCVAGLCVLGEKVK